MNAAATVVLVRYGAIPEVGRFAYALSEPPRRGQAVIIESHRGLELGTLLEAVRGAARVTPTVDGAIAEEPGLAQVVRLAAPEDIEEHDALRRDAQSEFARWRERIAAWGLDLELIDVEWTLDRRKQVLYVLGDRGAETTKLALQAAADGLAAVEVQPVGAEGVVPMPATGGGCGSGACGCHD